MLSLAEKNFENNFLFSLGIKAVSINKKNKDPDHYSDLPSGLVVVLAVFPENPLTLLKGLIEEGERERESERKNECLGDKWTSFSPQSRRL